MKETYEHTEIEPKWQKIWAKEGQFQSSINPQKRKYYLLEMFPYPSGKIHMGHVRNYTIGDVVARYRKTKGYNVLHPLGWDAFGLPAENAAIVHGIPPAKWTRENIENMKAQLKRLGLSVSWDREFATCDPEYYKWEQEFFIELFKRGLAYKKHSLVNWCTDCKTVLANEQVTDGKCWRCSSEVEKKELDQWFFKTTEYAEDLLKGLKSLEGNWPERVLTMQQNWIGRSEGSHIKFNVEGIKDEFLEVFTTRADTLYGATFMSVAPEHPIVRKFIKNSDKQKASEIDKFVKKTLKVSTQDRIAQGFEKEGVFSGFYSINPVTDKKMPIYIANFVVLEYGTGAVMAVPCHDQRDFEFSQKYELPLKVVIQPDSKDLIEDEMEEAYEGEGHLVNSGDFDGLYYKDAAQEITGHLEKIGYGEKAVHYRLRDWGISRQRYWGAPIPMIICEKCGTVPVDKKDLPVLLPTDIKFTGKGESPLKTANDFVNTKCPDCNGPAKRETDTMDTFVESSWYFLRYTSPGYKKGMFDKKEAMYWMPVDQYIGGIEHAVGHLMYARFFTRVLNDMGYIDIDEPFAKLLTQGMVIKGGEKMSKSKGNVVDPDDMVKKYGADTARMFLLFAAPPEKDLDWSDQGVEGCYRFLGRVYRLVAGFWDEVKGYQNSWEDADSVLGEEHKKLLNKIHFTIRKVTEDIERFHFNTAISSIMELINAIYQVKDSYDENDIVMKSILREAAVISVIILFPFAPHICDELWEGMGFQKSLINVWWPSYDEKYLKVDSVELVVQVNGKLRSKVEVPVNSDDEYVKSKILQDEKVKKFTNGKNVAKIIIVPNKLVNVVVR